MSATSASHPEITTTDSEVVYENKWIRVREDKIRRASGAEGLYSVVEKPDFAIILPVEDDHIYMVEQYRYPVGVRQLEFPQGTWDEHPQVDPQTLAKGELREETGLEAQNWTYIGFQYLAPGLCNQGYHIYLAQEFTLGSQQLDAEEEGLTVHRLPVSLLIEKIKTGEITDASTCNAFGLARLQGLI